MGQGTCSLLLVPCTHRSTPTAPVPSPQAVITALSSCSQAPDAPAFAHRPPVAHPFSLASGGGDHRAAQLLQGTDQPAAGRGGAPRPRPLPRHPRPRPPALHPHPPSGRRTGWRRRCGGCRCRRPRPAQAHGGAAPAAALRTRSGRSTVLQLGCNLATAIAIARLFVHGHTRRTPGLVFCTPAGAAMLLAHQPQLLPLRGVVHTNLLTTCPPHLTPPILPAPGR